MDIVQFLAEDHKKIVQNINKLPAALLKAKQNIDILLTLSGEIEKELSRHEKIEDLLLFPALNGKIAEQTLQSLVQEHAEMKKTRELFMERLAEMKEKGEPAPPDKIKEMSNHGYKLMRILSTHLTREDHLLFPIAKTVLSKERLEELEEESRKF